MGALKPVRRRARSEKDDMSEFFFNASVSTSERISLEGLDEVVATSRFMLEAWGFRDVSDPYGRALGQPS